MKTRLILAGMLLAAMAATLNAQPVIDFATSNTISGSISYAGSGGPLVGANIAIGKVAGIFTPANNNGVFPVIGGALNFTTGNLVSFNASTGVYTFASGGSLTITGAIPDASLGATTLVSAAAVAATYDPLNRSLTIVTGTDTKDPTLVAFFGLPAGTTFKFNGTIHLDDPTFGPGGAVSTPALFTDFANKAQPCSGVIGDFVWSDLNNNGIQDNGELGINGVTVTLYKGAVLPANLIATTLTGPAPGNYTFTPPGANGGGYYQFTGLCHGDYNVIVDSTQPALSGYLTSPSFQGGNTASDSNGSPAPVTLATDTATDETIDFGFFSPLPILVECAASTGQVGVSYSSYIVATGGVQPYTFSVVPGTLPAGLTLTTSGPNAGLISGVPTTAGTFSFTVTVTDSSGFGSGTVTKNCTIVIAPPPTANCIAITAVEGVAITPVTMIGTGGAGGPYTFTATGLPTGLNMSTGGTISGTPTVSGTFNYTVTVTDKDGHSGTVNCSVTVNPPPTANCVAITAVEGVAITPVTMIGTGGVGGPYTFTATGLPAGLSMSTGGTISGTPTVSGTFNYTVTVKDAAGNSGSVNCSVTVNPPPTANCVAIVAVQGVAITPVTMIGTGGAGGPYTFTATGLPAGLNMSTGGTISGTPTVSGTFNYTVTVKDAAGNSGSVNCSVTVNPPPTANCVAIVAVEGVAISPVTMIGTGGTGGPYTFTATGLPAGLSMSTGGTISGTPTVSGTFNYTVTVKDAAGNSGSVNCSVTVNPPPTANCVAIIAVEGVAITPVTMIGSGGVGGPYTFTATGLPAGLSMSTGGTISGTPTVSGTFNYTVTVKDAAGNSGSVNCSVTVNPPPTANCVAIVAVQGVAITPVTMIGSGGVGGPYTFTATGLPAGLSMSTGGTISGTPTVSGTFNYTVTVKDAAGNSGSVNCSVTVNPPPTANCVAIIAVEGVAITPVTMIGSGGVGGPYTFTATGLPAGLSMSTGGTISGTPTVSGTFNYTVTVKDAAGNSGSVNCSVTVNPPPTANCVAIVAVQGVAITPVTMIGSGGVGGPYTFTATGLPAGLSMSTGGTISGTPTVSGTFNYTVTVKDAAGNSGSVNCSVTVNPPPTANCVAIIAVQGTAITPVTMIGSGGVGGPYTFTATGLPAGLSMSTGGTISGTPTVSGTFNYTVTVKDAAGNTGSVNCSVTVNPPPTANCVAIIAVQGTAITPVTMIGSGGVGGPYTFTATGLPAGLNMSTGGTISGTPTVSGTFNYTVTVKDAAGDTGSVNCSVTVNPPPTANCIAIVAIQGVAITPVTMVGSGGTGGPYTFTVTGLPAGLSMSTGGTISGTPTVSGTFNYTVTVKDAAGNTGSVNCSVTVLTKPSASCVAIVAVQGVAITPVTMIGSGGVGGPYTFTATGLPAGLTMSTGGTISGIPTVSGTFNYTVTVKDAAGNTGSVNCSVTVGPPPTATCITIVAIQGVAITPVTMIGSGGAGGPYTFTATGLPAGLTMSTGGTISGTPTVSGTFNYTVTVKDKNLNVGTVNCSVTVLTKPSASCITINAVQGVAITPVTMIGTGGAGGPYTFSATGLPTGVTMSTSGVISGTPTVSGTFSYTVTVKDKNLNVGTVNCSVTVTPQVVCVPTVFDLTGGSSSGTGTFGNIRTFTAPNGVQVKVSAFARHKTTSAWTTAWLGAYAPGLGVTDNTESGSDPNHKVDNVGSQLNYVMFEFSQPVILNRAYLDYVTTDSDMTIWIGNKTNPFANHNTLSDSFLTSLGFTEENSTTLTTARWADVNSGHLSGNVIVIAASVAATTPDDYFKIAKLETECLPSVSTPTATCVSISASQYVAITPATLTGAGGAGGPYTFTATGLPAGLTMSSTGTISGTPTVSGVFPYVVTIKDKNGNTGTLNCSVTVLPQAVCPPSTFDFTGGNSASTGTAGNIRTFTAPNGVQVKVSAFARNKSTGTWSTAWLGAYAPGLGVTDSTENGSDPTHKIDNVGSQLNYVLLEFSAPVVVNRAFLDAVGADSDVTVWIGNKTNVFTNHLTLSDAVLNSLGFTEENLTTSPDSRWADVNASNFMGNVLVIAALASDTTAEDDFKLSKLDVSCRSIQAGDFTTYTPGGWGAVPSGNNPGMVLKNNFAEVYPTGKVVIGGTYKLTFTTSAAITAFLPIGSTPGVLTANATNPTTAAAGVFAGQVLSLRLSVDFSNQGITQNGLGDRILVSGALAGQTINQVLTLANTVLGGTTSALPAGLTVSGLNDIVAALNGNFDNGTISNGYVR